MLWWALNRQNNDKAYTLTQHIPIKHDVCTYPDSFLKSDYGMSGIGQFNVGFKINNGNAYFVSNKSSQGLHIVRLQELHAVPCDSMHRVLNLKTRCPLFALFTFFEIVAEREQKLHDVKYNNVQYRSRKDIKSNLMSR